MSQPKSMCWESCLGEEERSDRARPQKELGNLDARTKIISCCEHYRWVPHARRWLYRAGG